MDGSPWPPGRGAPSRPSSPCPPGAQRWQKGAVFKHNASAEENPREQPRYRWGPPPVLLHTAAGGAPGRAGAGRQRDPPGPPGSRGGIPGQVPHPGHRQGLPGPARLHLLSRDALTPVQAGGAGLAEGSSAERGGGLSLRGRGTDEAVLSSHGGVL